MPAALSLALMLSVPALLLTLVAAGNGNVPGDRTLTEAVQRGLPTWLETGIRFTNALGEAETAIAISAGAALIVAALGRRREALLLLLASSAWLGNAALKGAAESPRPPLDLVTLSNAPAGFGFPSGHVMGTTVLLVMCAVVARGLPRPAWMTLLAGLTVVAVLSGLGRVAVGAHWPSDVAGAYLWGGAWAAGLIAAQNAAARRWAVRFASHERQEA